MLTAVPTSASGTGDLSTTAALAALVLLIVVVAALPTAKSAVSGHIEQFRSYFFGPSAADGGIQPPGEQPHADPAADAAATEAPSGRASDRESYDFDLKVFNGLFGGPVDVPSNEQDTP